MLITETYLSSKIPDSLISIRNYSIYRCDRLNQTGGGCCIYINNTAFKEFKITNISFDCPGCESLALYFRSPTFDFCLVCVYQPPNTNPESDTILFDSINALSQEYNNLIIFGDFNYPNLHWPFPDRNTSSEDFLNMLENANLHQLVSQFTRFRLGQAPSLLDLILTTDPQLFSEINYLPNIGKSDHVVLLTNMQVVIRNTSKNQAKSVTVTDWENVLDELTQVNWDMLLELDNVNEKWSRFKTTVRESLERNSRTKTKLFNPLKL